MAQGLSSKNHLSLDQNLLEDAREALMDLGYRDQEIHRLFAKILDGTDFQPKKAEDLIENS
jgi:Holliday junction resolvasome RuvABC DNA-binding subunit